MKAKKLIEVAMPIKEISAESVRDKSIRHGHISTLHLWWARRPLPTCRAVVFASLVPDPLDENCPQAFCDAVQDLLGKNPHRVDRYAPYPDIPYTAIYDPMEDTLRNRLLMFIGKFSDKCQKNMIAGKTTPPKEQLQDGCLIKWESKNDPEVLRTARKLIWVAYNSEKDESKSFAELSAEFDAAFNIIKQAEEALYTTKDRHIASDTVAQLETNLQTAIEQFQSRMPSVFDPFAGGGAIPLEAARLGCRSYGNDINPVAHIIEKGSVEFPQKYGKPITYSRDEFERLYGEEGKKLLAERDIPFGNEIYIPNRLSFDVEYYAKQLIKKTEEECGWMYPDDEDGNKLIAYYWARTAKCSNPSCGARVPLLKGFQFSNTNSNQIHIVPSISNTEILLEFKRGKTQIAEGWNKRGTLQCPCCGSITEVNDVKQQSLKDKLYPRLIGGVYYSSRGKIYKGIHSNITEDTHRKLLIPDYPTETMTRNSNGGDTHPWGFTKWADLYSDRQLSVLFTFIQNIRENSIVANTEYANIIKTYLAILIDRIAVITTCFGRWNTARDEIAHMFNRQAIAMMFDFPEPNPFSGMSGSAINQLDCIIRYIESESDIPFKSTLCNASSGERSQFRLKSINAVVTDPPYYDAIAYADISDLFYMWLKRSIGDIYYLNFSTPQTPKNDECTAIKYHHDGNYDKAKAHFEGKLLSIFSAIEEQTSDVVSIMFAHQSTEAWTTLCNSILGAKMNITGSWAIDTERSVRTVGLSGDALESSVTVACRPSERSGYGSYKKVKKAIQEKVTEEVKSLYELGFRGADLLTACFGKAVSEFGNYETVEKADGSEVTVAELLDMARTAAFTALLRDFDGDDYTKFYIGWLQLNGMGETDFDDATKFTRVGMNINIGEVFAHGLLVKDEAGGMQHLRSYKESNKGGVAILPPDAPLIDKVHQTMLHWAEGDRLFVLRLINEYGQDINNEFWRVLVVLKELLPTDSDDARQVSGLLSNAETLIRDSKDQQKQMPKQGTLEFDFE